MNFQRATDFALIGDARELAIELGVADRIRYPMLHHYLIGARSDELYDEVLIRSTLLQVVDEEQLGKLIGAYRTGATWPLNVRNRIRDRLAEPAQVV